ncbi:MAG TPA: lysophospholipid acyltransferase family protein [Verrucomicrobiae bacterium]|nr:lysophospholipid acyltransferase family protein [Verrucomicrobiae bacterium]
MIPRRGAARTFRNRLVLAALAPIALVLAYLPPPVSRWIGARLGDLAWVTLRGRREVALKNLELALGAESSLAERVRIGRASFRNLGLNLVEACEFFFRPPERLLSRVEIRGLDHVRAAAAKGRGVLALAGHLGNWELLAAAAARGPVPIAVVARPLDDPMLDRVLERLRIRGGMEIISKRQGLGDIRDALRRGRIIGVLLDQNASRREGIFAPFFGVPASTSKGLALIALRTGAPVVPTFIRRLPAGRHMVVFEPPVAIPPDRDPAAFTAAFNEAIERAIRQAPEQWFWVHRRWKRRPAEASS